MDTDEPIKPPRIWTPEELDSLNYPGADIPPTFDHELGEPDDTTDPVEGVRERYREVARLHAQGCTNNDIAARLGYTASRLSILLRHPFVAAEVERYRREIIDPATAESIKAASRDGLQYIHKQVILNPAAKSNERLQASLAMVERAHGKPRQEIAVEHGGFIEFLAVARGIARDVTPAAIEPTQQTAALTESPPADDQDPLAAWLDAHLPPHT